MPSISRSAEYLDSAELRKFIYFAQGCSGHTMLTSGVILNGKVRHL